MSKKKKTKKPVAAVIPSKSLVTSSKVTESTILEEAAQLGSNYPKVAYPTVDMLAETREMLLARGDVPDLMSREYAVSDAMFMRLEFLSSLLGPRSVRAEAPRDRPDKTEAAEASRASLMSIREQLALIGVAAGFKASDFTVDLTSYNRLVDSMAGVIGDVVDMRDELPDKAKVDALVAEATVLIDAELAARLKGAVLSKQRINTTKTVGQLKRLLLDQLRHLSKQGLAAYPGDAVRELWYRLDRFQSGSKKGDSVAPVTPALTDDPGVAA